MGACLQRNRKGNKVYVRLCTDYEEILDRSNKEMEPLVADPSRTPRVGCCDNDVNDNSLLYSQKEAKHGIHASVSHT